MFKVLKNGKQPTRGTKHSACVDLYASEDITIGAGETKLVGLGVAIDLAELSTMFDEDRNMLNDDSMFDKFLNSHYLQLMLRSSLSKELIIANGVGVIDLDYKDEIKIRVHNPKGKVTMESDGIGNYKPYIDNPVRIRKGDKISQITLIEHKSYLFGIDSEVKRDGGFGSTDEKKDE